MERLVCEFAIDPDAVDSWDRLRFLDASTGWRAGRLISDFPKKWARQIYDKLETQTKKDFFITDCLQSLCRKTIRAGRANRIETAKWIDAALTQHSETPFRAIVTTEEHADQANKDFVLGIEGLHDNTPLWKVATFAPVSRDAQEIADIFGNVLKYSREVRLIDPYFSPFARRYCRPLKAITQAALNPNDTTPKTITYHVKHQGGEPKQFEEDCRAELPDWIQKGINVEFFIWSEKLGGQSFHDRFLSLKYGTAWFGQGLDDNVKADDKVNVSLEPQECHDMLDEQCDPTRSPFDLLHRFLIEGTR